MSEHEEHDEGCAATEVVSTGPCWEWNWLEVPAITCRVIGGIMATVAAGLNALGLEFQAAAEYDRTVKQQARDRWEHESARAEMAGTLEGLVLWDTPDVPQ